MVCLYLFLFFVILFLFVFFFFSSRRRHTRWTGDWSSDVCSSDLPGLPLLSLVDEFDDAASQSRDPRALQLAGAGRFQPLGVPFRHLVNVVQMADFDLDQVVVILRRNNYPVPDPAAAKERAGYAI